MDYAKYKLIPWDIPSHLCPWIARAAAFENDNVGLIRREMLVVGSPLVIAFGDPFIISTPDLPDVPSQPHRSFGAGVFDRYVSSVSFGPTSGVRIDLHPLGARAVFGVPMQEMRNEIVSVETLFSDQWRNLEEWMGNLTTWNERFALLQQFLEDRFTHAIEIPGELSWAWNQMLSTDGNISISDLVSELRWSRRRLREGFLDGVGVPAKTIARMIRYRKAMEFSVRNPDLNWAEIAATFGYTDQAHLHRNVVEFGGTTPTNLRKRFIPEPFFAEG